MISRLSIAITMPKYTPRGKPASETSDQQTVVDKDTLALCVIELLNDESVLNRLEEILFPKNERWQNQPGSCNNRALSK